MGESILKIYFWPKVSKEENYPAANYRTHFTNNWFKDPYVQFVLENVDKCKWIENDVVRSPWLGIIPMDRLSSTFKTLTMAYYMRDLKFPLRNVGDNCAEALYRGALGSYTSWNYQGYMPEVLPEQICYFPELDARVTGDKVQKWLLFETPPDYNPIEWRRRRKAELDAIDIKKGRKPPR
ncbi:MAG: DUF4869 domain-containing protein [Lachnospiraceae bacterium]|nr:DUF4869 domain-containing protein [Lachnospiraceae bacterium]